MLFFDIANASPVLAVGANAASLPPNFHGVTFHGREWVNGTEHESTDLSAMEQVGVVIE